MMGPEQVAHLAGVRSEDIWSDRIKVRKLDDGTDVSGSRMESRVLRGCFDGCSGITTAEIVGEEEERKSREGNLC